MKTFRDRVAVVTGAASGIGLALAERFAAEGMKVVLADVERDALAAAEKTVGKHGGDTLAVPTDVSKAADVEALAARTTQRFGAVHVVCNNAGVGGDGGPVWEHPPESWAWVLGVNLWGVIHGLRTFVPLMLAQSTEGHVVNTASMAGHVSSPFLGPYHATKFAVVAMSECLHFELGMAGAKVKASVLCPGFVKTRIFESERNRPADLQTPPQTSELSQAWRTAFEGFIAAGLPPETVAERVVEAIRAERFWVFPHPELLPGVQARAEGIVAQRNPELNLPPELQQGLPPPTR